MWPEKLAKNYLFKSLKAQVAAQGGIHDFFRRGCTRLLLYFNTNKPHSFFCRIPVVLEAVGHLRGGGVAPPAPSP